MKRDPVAQVVQAVEHRQVALARDAEGELHALGGERVGEDPAAVAGLEVGFHAVILSECPAKNAPRLAALGHGRVRSVEHAAEEDEAVHHVRVLLVGDLYARRAQPLGVGAAFVDQAGRSPQ